jgi:hypothetical protein
MRISDQRGFALFGLLLVATTTASLFYIWGLEMHQQIKRDREKMLIETGIELSRALSSYHKRNIPLSANSYPTSIEDLLEDKRGSYTVKHLRAIPLDPITGSADWAPIRFGGKIVCFHSRSSARPLRATFTLDEIHALDKSSYRELHFCAARLIERNP